MQILKIVILIINIKFYKGLKNISMLVTSYLEKVRIATKSEINEEILKILINF